MLSLEGTDCGARLNVYYAANAALYSWCTVMPESTEDVQAAIRILTRRQCLFGIKSGAPSVWKGSNGIDEDITIGLGYRNSTSCDPDTGIVSIQPGVRRVSVFEELRGSAVLAVVGVLTFCCWCWWFTTCGEAG